MSSSDAFQLVALLITSVGVVAAILMLQERSHRRRLGVLFIIVSAFGVAVVVWKSLLSHGESTREAIVTSAAQTRRSPTRQPAPVTADKPHDQTGQPASSTQQQPDPYTSGHPARQETTQRHVIASTVPHAGKSIPTAVPPTLTADRSNAESRSEANPPAAATTSSIAASVVPSPIVPAPAPPSVCGRVVRAVLPTFLCNAMMCRQRQAHSERSTWSRWNQAGEFRGTST